MVDSLKAFDPKRPIREVPIAGFDQQDFYATVAAYLHYPELRHSVLDWIMVDMMVSRELSAFGDASPIWSIIDRVIQNDPAVWIVQATE